VEEILLSLNAHWISDIRQIEIHTTEPLVPDSSPVEVENAIANLNRYKPPGSDQIRKELIQAGSEMLRSEVHKLINSISYKEDVPNQWKKSVIAPIHKKCDITDCSNYRGISLLSISYRILFINFQG
jgi:hypothetical protein